MRIRRTKPTPAPIDRDELDEATVAADALRRAAHDIEMLHPGEEKASATFLRARADALGA